MHTRMLSWTPQDFAKALRDPQTLRSPRDPGKLAGRVLKGRTPKDFLRLSDDLRRPLVFVLDGAGLVSLLGKHPDQILESLGYLPSFVASQRTQGKSFQIALFLRPEGLKKGTWDSVFEMAGEIFPNLQNLFRKHAGKLQSLPFEAHVQESKGYPWQEVRNLGRRHPEWFSADRLGSIASPKSWEVRAFFLCEFRLSPLFAGDGFTRHPDGAQGLGEWLLPNQELRHLQEVHLVPLA